MAVTKQARNALNVTVVPHTDASKVPMEGRLTPTGLLKLSDGSLVTPSSSMKDSAGLRTGQLDTLTDKEQAACGQSDILLNTVRGPDQKESQEAEEVEFVPELVKRGKKRTRRSSKEQDKTPQEVPKKPHEMVTVRLVLPGVGVVPSQYHHVYSEGSVVVLGATDLSYVPVVATQVDDQIVGAFEFQDKPGVKYIYSGMKFRDADDVTNLIIHELPKL